MTQKKKERQQIYKRGNNIRQDNTNKGHVREHTRKIKQRGTTHTHDKTKNK